MFCTKCGKELMPNARFCTNCGAAAGPLQSAAPPIQSPAVNQQMPPRQYAPAPVPTGESVTLVLKTSQKQSVFKSIECYAVFMPDKLVLAYLTDPMRNAENSRISQEIKQSGTGFLKGSAAMMGYWANYQKKYYTMASAAILAENPTNFLVFYRDIVEVLFKCYSTTTSFDDSSDTVHEGKLQLTLSNGNKFVFAHQYEDESSVRNALGGLFGVRLKYKR